MSRAYEMDFEVLGLREDEVQKVQKVIEDIWATPDNEVTEKQDDGTIRYRVYGLHNNLCAGEAEDEFANRVAIEVWEALGRFVEVTVTAICLEYLPSDVYTRDEDDYALWCKLYADGTQEERPGTAIPTTPPLNGRGAQQ